MRLLVVGGGSAGASAALQARELGVQVTLLEADEVGGTSLNRGPAPVRTLARAARLARDWSSWAEFGLDGPSPVPNLPAILANSARIARYARDRKHMAAHLRRNGVDLAEHLGPVRFTSPDTLRAGDGRSWTADRIILAVGGHAAKLPLPGGDLALSYEDLPSLTALPRTAAIVGGADTGCQIASILADFGASITLLEAGRALLPTADASLSAALGQAFEARGIGVRTSALAQALERSGDQVSIRYRHNGGSKTASFDAVFAAIGWPASIAPLALEKAGVAASPQAIAVDDFLRTSAEHIFAAGDATGHAKLVSVARAEGRIAAENAINEPTRRAACNVIPSGSFTDPEYGQVGLTEAQAAQHHEIVVGIARYEDLLRPVADGRPDGFCKLVADRGSHAILGAHVLGEYSAEVVQVVAAAMAGGMSVEQVGALQFAFPTFTEAIGMAAQKICREIGAGLFPLVWSELGPEVIEEEPS